MSELDLHAYLDDALDAEMRAAFEARLTADPVLREKLVAFRADKARLTQLFTPLAEQPLPQAWLDQAQAPVRRAPDWRWLSAIAAVLVIAVGLSVAYFTLRPAGEAGIVEAALSARTGGGELVAVNANSDIHHYDQVVAQAVALPVKAPDMRRMGYRLEQIHTYPATGSGGAVELSYRDGEGRSLTLYVRRSDGSVRFDQFPRGNLRVCVWQDDRLGMVVAGDVSTAAMQRLASLAYTGLTI